MERWIFTPPEPGSTATTAPSPAPKSSIPSLSAPHSKLLGIAAIAILDPEPSEMLNQLRRGRPSRRRTLAGIPPGSVVLGGFPWIRLLTY